MLAIPSFYQDRLGTNVGRAAALKKEMMRFLAGILVARHVSDLEQEHTDEVRKKRRGKRREKRPLVCMCVSF
eukprot:COSAG06_NODE_5001_length_3796_cov_29.826393_3_plen_72_part_00